MLRSWRNYRRETRGAAAAEFALTLIFLVFPLLSATDLGIYIYQRMEVQNAAQVASQAAWAACDTAAKLPATTGSPAHCAALDAAVNAAAWSTSLGTNVTVTSKTEGFYCVSTSTSALVAVGTFPGTKPANCSSVGSSAAVPGDYIIITTSYTYTPVFTGVSLASLLTTPMTSTVWMRLG
jgi:Flp pilus assembly protein TadG